jgi:hypothetical protein
MPNQSEEIAQRTRATGKHGEPGRVHLVTTTILKGWKSFRPGLRGTSYPGSANGRPIYPERVEASLLDGVGGSSMMRLGAAPFCWLNSFGIWVTLNAAMRGNLTVFTHRGFPCYLNTFARQSTTLIFALLIMTASAATLYVDHNSATPTAPYNDWSTAAKYIQDAINASTNGDLVLVADGTYGGATTIVYGVQQNRVAINKPITVQSVNGPASTTIIGHQSSSPYWCTCNARGVYVGNGATFSGFTVSGGATGGYDDVHEKSGGGVWCEGTAVVSNCVVTGNRALTDAGGIYGGTVVNCTITGNSAVRYGGAAKAATMNNCFLTGNSASRGAAVAESTLNNCTVLGNSVTPGSLYTCGGALSCTVNNSIILYNSTYNYEPGPFEDATWFYSCTTPLHIGAGNFDADPGFVNSAAGDYHLQTNSPCINAGNNAYVATATDFDGKPRVKGGTVDLGAYEFQSPASLLSYAWAQQYGIPTDGSADFLDPDGDGMNNYQESVAGTNPTNSASLLVLYTPTSDTNGLNISWQSVDNRIYYLQRASNLGGPSAFSTLGSNILGQAGTTLYTDTTSTNGAKYFYRIGIQ